MLIVNGTPAVNVVPLLAELAAVSVAVKFKLLPPAPEPITSKIKDTELPVPSEVIELEPPFDPELTATDEIPPPLQPDTAAPRRAAGARLAGELEGPPPTEHPTVTVP